MSDSTPPDDIEMDGVFKALADPTRRAILDLLGATPGLTVGELTTRFPVSRFAIMKHLKVLTEAQLVTDRRRGRHRELFMNAVPIQLIEDRWMSHHSRRWASRLTGLKHALEAGAMEPIMTTPTSRYQIHIRTSPAALWEAITQPSETQKYFYGTAIQFRPEVGSPVEWTNRPGTDEASPAITGTILECVPEQRLVHSFNSHFGGEGDPESKVTWEIEQLGHVCKLTITHEHQADTETYRSTDEGWWPIVSGLKTLLETGEPLAIPSA